MDKDYSGFEPSLILLSLKSRLQFQKTISMFLTFDAPQEDRLQAVRDSIWFLDDAINLLEGLWTRIKDHPPRLGVNPRLPKGFPKQPTISEFLETMQVSIDILAIEIEFLLNQTMEVSEEEYRRRSELTKDLIKVLGKHARYTKAVVLARDPQAWDEALERRFEKMLKIAP